MPASRDSIAGRASAPSGERNFPLRGLAIALLIVSPLLLVAAVAALVISWNISAEARDELAALVAVRGTVLQTTVKPTFVPRPPDPGEQSLIDPATGMPPGDWEYSPQVLIRYQQDGETVEQWIELEEPLQLNDQWRAQQLINRYRAGDEFKAWYDPADAGELLLKVGDGGRQMLIAGRVVAALLALPAFGLLLAAILLLRLTRRQAAVSRAPTAVPESAAL
jgi:hypothetical protein